MKPKISRRDFLKIGAMGAATAALTGCKFPRRWVTLEPFVKPPEEQLAGQATWYASTCRMCPAGCGIIVRLMNGRALKIEGNPQHPLNQGKLCARGQAGLQLLYNPDRLSGPVSQAKRGSRQYQSLSWNEALNRLYTRLQEAGSSVAIWLGSTTSGHVYDVFKRYTAAVGAPDPLVFDLYTAMNGYPVLAAAGQGLPGYPVDQADVIFSFGANFLGPGPSQVRYGVDYGAFRSRPLGQRGYLVQFEPRMSLTGVKADRWYAIKPGTENLVAQAILRIIADGKLGSPERAQQAAALASNVDLNAAASASEISVDELKRLAGIFANAQSPLAIPGAPLTGQDNATDATLAVQALNLVAAAGQSGGSALSAPAPVSGLAKPQPSTFPDLQNLSSRISAGQVKLLLVYGANPAYELPSVSGFLPSGLEKIPSVVSFSPMVDETAAYADLILPDHTYLEAWGYDVVSPNFGAPVVSGQQPVVTPLYDTRATADVMLTAARGISKAAAALPWPDEVTLLKETIAQLPAGAAGGSGTDVLWARFQQYGGWWPNAASESLPNPPPASPKAAGSSLPPATPAQFEGAAEQFPYYLHLYLSDLLSDGRGANLPWLQSAPDPMTTIAWQTWVELNPDTAKKLGISDGDVVQVSSRFGLIEAPVYTYPAIRPDTVAIPMGQGHSDYGRYAQGRGSNPVALVGMQADSGGNGMVWSNVRVMVKPTGKRASMAWFENKQGVIEGFTNQGFPGQ